MINVRIEEVEANGGTRWNGILSTKDWGGFENTDVLAIANAKDVANARSAAKHLLNRLAFDAFKALQDIGGLTPIQEFGLAVLLEDPQACDAVRDVLGI